MKQLPFGSIAATPEEFSGTNTIARFVEALGFRYRWATEGITTNEFLFRPSEDSMNMQELLEHLFSMAKYINASFGGETTNEGPASSIPEMRAKTIEIYAEIVQRLKTSTDCDFESYEKSRMENGAKWSFWLILNGPISDSLTPVGQITSWRRISGNPQPKGVNVLKGTVSL